MGKRVVVDASFAPAVYGLPEANPFLQGMKKNALSRINSKPRYHAICRQRDLAICLLALARRSESIAVLRFAQEGVTHRSGFAVWDSASHAAGVIAYIREKQHGYSASGDLQRFIDHPANALFTQPEVYTTAGIYNHLHSERVRFQWQFTNSNPDVAIEAMCWWASTLIFFRQFAKMGYQRQNA